MSKWADGPVSLENSDHRYYDIPEFGYLRYRDYYGGETFVVYVHQLVYLADNPDVDGADVFSNGRNVVHHGTDERLFENDAEAKCPLFNWGENLHLEEKRYHADRHMNGPSWRDPEDGAEEDPFAIDEEMKTVKRIIKGIEANGADLGAPEVEVMIDAMDAGLDRTVAEQALEDLRLRGEVYEPDSGYYKAI